MPLKPPIHCDPTHQAALDAARRQRDLQRGSSAQRGYGRRWAKAARAYLCRHPLCVICQQHDRIVAAAVVDHIIPHRGDSQRFWDQANWQALCKSCHSYKTATEDGGFGHPPGPGNAPGSNDRTAIGNSNGACAMARSSQVARPELPGGGRPNHQAPFPGGRG